MMDPSSIDNEAMHACFSQLEEIVRVYIRRGKIVEAFSASEYLLATNIIVCCRTNQLNIEQYMELTFERINNIVSGLERSLEDDK